ncbi:hypothetical protein [Streptomyces mirabilis]|uniref:hypothetical protein n=1 Tax=Streptomyces mirabilis TaxID=68239 RepID=UPI0036ACA78B
MISSPNHIDRFINWVDAYCADTGREERIPPDLSGRKIYPVRFRRTLAWHIAPAARSPGRFSTTTSTSE